MLAKANRLRKADDFRATMKFGRKASSETIVLYLKRDSDLDQSRFGFIVSKAVGNAVTRNLVKRRLRAAALQSLSKLPENLSIVARALPAAASVDWNKLCLDFETALERLGAGLRHE